MISHTMSTLLCMQSAMYIHTYWDFPLLLSSHPTSYVYNCHIPGFLPACVSGVCAVWCVCSVPCVGIHRSNRAAGFLHMYLLHVVCTCYVYTYTTFNPTTFDDGYPLVIISPSAHIPYMYVYTMYIHVLGFLSGLIIINSLDHPCSPSCIAIPVHSIVTSPHCDLKTLQIPTVWNQVMCRFL